MGIQLATRDINIAEIADTPQFYEDTSFVTGESPVTLDFNTDLGGANSTQGFVINDGDGNFTVEFSTNGIFSGTDAITMKNNEILKWSNISVDSIKITHSGTDSAYRVAAI